MQQFGRRFEDGELLGAPLSDNGHIIIAMFFDAPEGSQDALLMPVAGGRRLAPQALFCV